MEAQTKEQKHDKWISWMRKIALTLCIRDITYYPAYRKIFTSYNECLHFFSESSFTWQHWTWWMAYLGEDEAASVTNANDGPSLLLWIFRQGRSSRLWLSWPRRIICLLICCFNPFFHWSGLWCERFCFVNATFDSSDSRRFSWLKGELPGTRTLTATIKNKKLAVYITPKSCRVAE